jgi:hypothetical protein
MTSDILAGSESSVIALTLGDTSALSAWSKLNYKGDSPNINASTSKSVSALYDTDLCTVLSCSSLSHQLKP